MTRTLENVRIVCVKFFGKIERMLVADLACVIVYHFKSICRTLLLITLKDETYFWNLEIIRQFELLYMETFQAL